MIENPIELSDEALDNVAGGQDTIVQKTGTKQGSDISFASKLRQGVGSGITAVATGAGDLTSFLPGGGVL